MPIAKHGNGSTVRPGIQNLLWKATEESEM
jgi:hypothetical protein